MKILVAQFKVRRSQRGSAVMVVMTMLAIMIICVTVNLVALSTVDRELKLLDKKQAQHWQGKSMKSTSSNSPAN